MTKLVWNLRAGDLYVWWAGVDCSVFLLLHPVGGDDRGREVATWWSALCVGFDGRTYLTDRSTVWLQVHCEQVVRRLP